MSKRGIWLALACLSLTSIAHAQMYRCLTGGTTYISDKPCVSSASKTSNLGQIGEQNSPTTYRSRPTEYRSYGYESAEKAPLHQQYLSGTCASIADAIRTAPVRGVNYQVIRDLRAEYDQKCQEEDRVARNRASADQRASHDEKITALKAADLAKANAAKQENQCNAMRDVLAVKRQKLTSMTPIEKANFGSFEASFNAKCLRAP